MKRYVLDTVSEKKNIRNDFYQFLESTLQYKNNNNNSFLDVATAQLKIHIIV